MIQALTFAVTGTYTSNQVTAVAVDRFPTTEVPTFVAVETSLVDPADAQLVVEAIITTQIPSDVVMASCKVHRLVIFAVVLLCTTLPRTFAAKMLFYQSRIHPTLAVVEEPPATPEFTYAVQVLYVQSLLAAHVVEGSTTIPLLISVVATICCRNLRVPPVVATKTTIQARKNAVITADTILFRTHKAADDMINTMN